MTHDITSINTPGIYYAIGYTIASTLLLLLVEKKRKLVSVLLCQGVFLGIDILLMTINPGGKIFFWPVTLLNVLLMYLQFRISSPYGKKACVHLALNGFMMGEFFSSNEWMVYYFALKNFHYPYTMPANIIMLLTVHAFVVAMFAYMEKRLWKNIGMIDVKTREIISEVFIVLAVYSISNICYVAGEDLFGGIYASEIFVIRTLVDVGGVSILYAFRFLIGETAARLERDRLQDILEMQQMNYKMLEQSMEIVNIKYHDLKHQIAIIRDGLEQGQSLKYLDRMEQEIKIYETQNKTGNSILDTILTAKSIYCQSQWIEMTVVADGAALSFMEPMDISALFGNMIDNAIESVKKIERKEKRLIHLAVARQKGFVRIRLENCYDKKPNIVNGRIKTSKKDARYHGYGMKSIEAIAKKYGGSVTIQAENGWFEQRILIPVE